MVNIPFLTEYIYSDEYKPNIGPYTRKLCKLMNKIIGAEVFKDYQLEEPSTLSEKEPNVKPFVVKAELQLEDKTLEQIQELIRIEIAAAIQQHKDLWHNLEHDITGRHYLKASDEGTESCKSDS